jgi:transposase InsO family protein
VIGNKKVTICTEVVNNDIPLLLSKASLKKAGVVLDFNNDTVRIMNSNIKLWSSSSGHYCLPLSNFLISNKGNTPVKIVLHTYTLENMSVKEKKNRAMKLHRQFSHASKEKLCKLVKDSRNFNDKVFLKMIEDCCDECEVCQKFKRPPLRPVVGMPLADNFNQVVCMDLKEHIHNQSWIFHMIDSATRYSAACIVYSKRAEEIIDSIFSMWITYFGAPRKFLSDNGGEFSNDSFREMTEKLNIEAMTTAGESPFSNGIVERHNLIIAESMKKTLLDIGCDPKMALAWAVSAKNSLHNQGGFSPNQLVFGHNINLPTVLNDKLPAMEVTTSNDILYKNLQARENFIQAESSEKIRRALRSNVRSYADVTYENHDKVYYRRKNFKGWKGPGVVLGQDGQFVLIRHGGAYYRIHPCQLMKVKMQHATNAPVTKVNDSKNSHGCDGGWDSDEDAIENHDDVDVEDNLDDQEQIDNDFEGFPDVEGKGMKPKRNTLVKFRLEESSTWKDAKILSIQPKQTGKYKDWINVHITGDPDPSCINWDLVDQWKTLPDPENPVLLTGDQALSQEVVDAKAKEIDNLINNSVFETVPYQEQLTISSRWIITEKFRDGKKKVKARLVARGFEEDSSNLKKDSPTCSRESLRLVFLTAAMKSWKLQSVDITAAFLQGNPIERDIYLRPPSDVCSRDKVWHLKRCIYGLNDAPRSWYDKVCQVLKELGATISAYDNALFLWHDEKSLLIGLLACHVDDFTFCGNEKFQTIIRKLKDYLKIKEHHSGSFKYLGLNVSQSDQGVQVDQDLYIPSICPIEIAPHQKSRRNDELNIDERKELKRLSGQMMWVTSQTRPDISFETCTMSNTGKHPTVKMLHDANKGVSKLKSKSVTLKFPNLGNADDLKVVTYCDATYASLQDGSSHGGFMVFVKGINDKVAPICWQSKKLSRVTKSPLASETLALCEAADAAFLVSTMLQEIFKMSSLPPIECVTDNGSLYDTLQTTNIISDRRLRVDIARLRELVKNKEIDVSWIRGKGQLADSLTKFGASTSILLDVLKYSQI